MIRPLLLAAVFLLAAPLASPALSLVSAERVDARQGRDKALYVFTHRHIAAGRLAGGVPLAYHTAELMN